MSLPLSLKVWPTQNDVEDSLPVLVKRINEERDHFRNITEDSLQKEIENENTTQDIAEDGVHSEDSEQRRKALYVARADMLKFVRYCLNCPTNGWKWLTPTARPRMKS